MRRIAKFPRKALPVLFAGVLLAALGLATLLYMTRHTSTATHGPCGAQPVNPCEETLTTFLSEPLPKNLHWVESPTLVGPGYVAALPQVGIFEVDSKGAHVIVAVFVATASSGSAVNMNQAQTIAMEYAKKHFPGGDVSKLQLREAKLLNQTGFQEFSFTWQGQQGEAWLPTYTHVGVSTGGVIREFSYFELPLKVGTQPRVSASNADETARTALHLSSTMTITSTSLEVMVVPGGTERLVWHVVFEGSQAGVLARLDAMVDALTGAFVSVA